MADPISPVTDSYIDGIIKASDVYNPNLNLTQGVQVRILIKQLRDYLLQEIGDVNVGLTDILYADLVTAMAASTLAPGSFYRITDFQTSHNIINSSPVVVNIGPIEPLIVLAIAANQISAQAWSEQYPQDVLYYNIENIIAASLKGVITKRIDTRANVEVCNDFRNVLFRRWKLKPPAWSATKVYTRFNTIQYTDGAIYFVNNPAGVPAGDIPSATSDNWVQLLPNNNYHVGRTSISFTLTTAGQPTGISSPSVPCDPTDFVDVPLFQDYDDNFPSRYFDITVKGTPGMIHNLVVFCGASPSYVISKTYIGYFSDSTPQSSTIILDVGYMSGCTFDRGFVNSCIFVSGNYIFNWSSKLYIYGSIVNCKTIQNVSAGLIFCLVRQYFSYVNTLAFNYCILPANVHDVYSPGVIGALKCYTNAFWKSVLFLSNLEVEYNGTPDQSSENSASSYVNVFAPLSNKTFIGNIPIDGDDYQAIVTQSAIDRAANRKIIYIGADQPSEKTLVKITNNTQLSVDWQSDLVPFSADNSFISGGDTAGLATYFSRHGNDFQVQQKDLISGLWVINYTPTYTIDSSDGNGNITSVTFTPKDGASETRFIIV